MAKRRKKRGATAWNRTFGAVAKTCFAVSSKMGGSGADSYGKCMRDELKAASRKRKKR